MSDTPEPTVIADISFTWVICAKCHAGQSPHERWPVCAYCGHDHSRPAPDTEHVTDE